MIKKFFRIIFSLVGVLFGYGVFLLLRFLFNMSSLADQFILTDTKQVIAAFVCAIIFGLLFFLLTPVFGKHGIKVSKYI